MDSGGGSKDLENEKALFFPSSDKSGSELQPINCLGCFNRDLGISTIEFHLTNWKAIG